MSSLRVTHRIKCKARSVNGLAGQGTVLTYHQSKIVLKMGAMDGRIHSFGRLREGRVRQCRTARTTLNSLIVDSELSRP